MSSTFRHPIHRQRSSAVPTAPVCPILPRTEERLDYRVLSAHGDRRDEAFYLDTLRYAHQLWLRGLAGRALLALARGLYADVPPSSEILRVWPLPYEALHWMVRTHHQDDFPGNPRVSFQHQAIRLRGPRAALRRARAWAAWALICDARPSLPGDPELIAAEPSRDSILADLNRWGHPSESVRWQQILNG